VGGLAVTEHVLLHVAAVERGLRADQALEVTLAILFGDAGLQKLHDVAYRRRSKNKFDTFNPTLKKRFGF
jgi:hypothetical protein